MTENEKTISAEDYVKVIEKLANGSTIAQATGMSKDTLEGLYALAYNLYSSGNYKDAETIFTALAVYESNEYRFWMGLGGCRQALGKFEQAIDAYQFAAISVAMKNPDPLFYAAKCLLKMNRKDDAAVALEACTEMADKSNPAYAATLEKANAILSLLKTGA